MVDESGYRAEHVWAWLDTNAERRACDGRVMRIRRQLVRESHRNTIARWLEQGTDPIPLGRWDEILMDVGLMIWEYEDDTLERFGSDGYVSA